MKKVLVVGSNARSNGGVTSVIKLINEMPIWDKYTCYWLGTQIQANRWKKLWVACSAYAKALFIIWRYDIVHFHTVPDVSMMIQLPIFLLALIGRKKIILHLHCGNQLTWDSIRNNKLAHWCMQKADRLVLLAHTFDGFIQKYWEDVKTLRTVVYNPCQDVESIPYVEHENTILYAGRFTDNKCGWLLIKAFNLIHKKYPDWKLQLLGNGEELPIYLKLIEEYGLKGKVEMPGFLHGEELAAYFRKAGIYGMTSHFEGVPMVVLEAWNYGVPVVSTPVGGLPEMLIEDKTGCVFDFDDYEGLAKQLDHLMGDYELRKEMSNYCMKFANDNFSMDKINKDIDNLYSSL